MTPLSVMNMIAGARFGPYHITAAIGSGGMGEVYRARDTRLNRDVAIKVLPEALASDPERVRRFTREAQALAALNHPHIAQIYGVEESEGIRALVMELVEGETLADRIARGRIPPAEALAIATQVAEALDAAHERGIIHRDLKPANIKVTDDGAVKVLDFGLAKAADAGARGAGGAIGVDTDEQLLNSPTVTSPAMTHAGVILGTAAYMSPEQARGKAVDKRADIWAFGVVIHEMLTGRRLFTGDTVSDTLAEVLKRDIDCDAIPVDTPSSLRRVIERCLQRDPKQRLRDIGDALSMLSGAESAEPPTRVASWRRVMPWLASAAVVGLLVATAIGFLRQDETNLVLMRFQVALGTPEQIVLASSATGPVGNSFAPVIAPDGGQLAFTAQGPSGRAQLWLRALHALTARPLAGTDGAAFPFWSPDSQSVAFVADGKLQRIEVASGYIRTLADANQFAGDGAWSADDVILFSRAGRGLWMVPAAGGEPRRVTEPTQQGPTAGGTAERHVYPRFLPDGNRFVYWGSGVEAGIYLADLRGATPRRLLKSDSGALYAPPGWLLFVRDDVLLAQRFDSSSGTLSGDPQALADDVATDEAAGVMSVSVSTTGVMTYRRGGSLNQSVRLVVVDRNGKEMAVIGVPAAYRGVELSRDGTILAVHRHSEEGGDIWITKLDTGDASRLTFTPSAENSNPLFSHDGQRIRFTSFRQGKWRLFEKPVAGGGESELVASDTGFGTLTANAEYLLSSGGGAAWVRSWRRPEEARKTTLLARFAQISPDGKWVASTTGMGGQTGEVVVQPFPEGDGYWQVSTSGGTWPRWRGDGKELFFVSRNNLGKMMAVLVKTDGRTFEAGPPRELFDTQYTNLGPHRGPPGLENAGTYLTYAVFPDGQRFVIPRAPIVSPEVTMILNWTEALAR